MDLLLSKPNYRCKPLKSISAVARALRFEEQFLLAAAARADHNYRTVRLSPGSTRQTFDAIGLLKEIHRRIKSNIFANVTFPEYLQGSLKGCDYVTNASLHTNKQLLICEDVKRFFPSVTKEKVEDIWQGFFGFSPNVAKLLAQLTTKDGILPQGAITSSYLANLVLWRDEPLLQAKFADQGITYSRYVDDMVMSSENHLSKDMQTWAVAQIYGMLRRNGLKANRSKHEVFSASMPMIATKLIVNVKPSLNRRKRSQVRAQVHQLEIAYSSESTSDSLLSLTNKASQQVGQLGRFHPTQANNLKLRVKAVREKFAQSFPYQIPQGLKYERDALVEAETDTRTAQLLVEAMQQSPCQDVDVELSRSTEMPVRAVDL